MKEKVLAGTKGEAERVLKEKGMAGKKKIRGKGGNGDGK